MPPDVAARLKAEQQDEVWERIKAIQEKRSELKHTGSPRAIAFTLSLKKVSDVPIGTKGKALLLGLGLVRNLTGV